MGTELIFISNNLIYYSLKPNVLANLPIWDDKLSF